MPVEPLQTLEDAMRADVFWQHLLPSIVLALAAAGVVAVWAWDRAQERRAHSQ